jgi:hypothetical protein
MAGERLQPVWKFRKGTVPSDRAVWVVLELSPDDVESAETLEALQALPRAPWRAVYSIEFDEGRAAIGGVALEPTDPTEFPPLAAELARELLKPGGALSFARTAIRGMIEEGDAAADERAARERYFAAFHGLDIAQLTERRGKRQPDYFYASIAALYVEAHTVGSRRPVADVADQLPTAYKAPFVRDALSKARERGLLERSAGQRHAGGELTAAGRQVLDEGPPEGYVGPAPASRIGVQPE